MNTRIEAILFDLGNTLRVLYEDAPYQARPNEKWLSWRERIWILKHL